MEALQNVKINLPDCTWTRIKGSNVQVIATGTCTVDRIDDSLTFSIGAVVHHLKGGMPVVHQATEERVVFILQSSEEGVLLGLATTSIRIAPLVQKLLEDIKCLEAPGIEIDEKKEEKKESTVAKHVNKLASVISRGGKLGLHVIDSGTERVKQGIHSATEKAKEKLPQKEVPTQVSDATRAKVEKARMASNVAVNVTSAMFQGAMDAVTQMSDSLKPVLTEYLEKAGVKSDKPTGPKTKAAINVTKSSAKAALEIYLATREAAVAVMSASMDATAELIDHRYGQEAGGVAKDASNTAKNALEVTKNIGGLGVKSIAKKLAVDTVLKSVEEPEILGPGEPVPQVESDLKEQNTEIKRKLSLNSTHSIDSCSVHTSSILYDMD